MSTLLRLAGKLPGWVWRAAALLTAAAIGTAFVHAHGVGQGRSAVQALWDDNNKASARAETKAVAQRAAENLAQARKHAAQAAAITKVYDEEINDVRARLTAAERMRKPAFCASAGPAAPAGGSGAEGGAAADPASRLLPEAVARDIQALILRTEEVAATGRACQVFIMGNIAP